MGDPSTAPAPAAASAAVSSSSSVPPTLAPSPQVRRAVIDLERVKRADLSDLNAALFVLLSETPSMKLGHQVPSSLHHRLHTNINDIGESTGNENVEHPYWHAFLPHYPISEMSALCEQLEKTLEDESRPVFPLSCESSDIEKQLFGSGLQARFMPVASSAAIESTTDVESTHMTRRPRLELASTLPSSSFDTESPHVFGACFESNDPTEDGNLLFRIPQLTNTFCAVVIDGHGGQDVRNLILKYFVKLFFNRMDFLQSPRFNQIAHELSSQSTSKSDPFSIDNHMPIIISACLYGAIMEMEAIILFLSMETSQINTSGACFSAAIHSKDKIICANVGDCRINILRQDASGRYKTYPLTVDHTCTHPEESKRIKSLANHGKQTIKRPYEYLPIRPSSQSIIAAVRRMLPERKDIIDASPVELLKRIEAYLEQHPPPPTTGFSVQEWQPIATALDIPFDIIAKLPARVCGSLQVSRSIGDAYLKNARFPGPADKKVGFRYASQRYTGVIATPDIIGYNLTPDDAGILLMSDGITNSLRDIQIAQCFENTTSSSVTVAEEVVTRSLDACANSVGFTRQEMFTRRSRMNIRTICDDMTFITWIFPEFPRRIEDKKRNTVETTAANPTRSQSITIIAANALCSLLDTPTPAPSPPLETTHSNATDSEVAPPVVGSKRPRSADDEQ